MTRTVLLVEDDPDVRAALGAILRSDGHEVQNAPDGASALRLLRDGLRPSVVLLDLRMPNMDGYRFRVAQRADPELAQIPVIVITADRKPNEDLLGAAACVRKPFDPSVLLREVSRFTG